MLIRLSQPADHEAIWDIIRPAIREGETLALPIDLSRDEALAYWLSAAHEVFVAEDQGAIVGTYYIRPNHQGGGSHVANCGYATASQSMGKGVARAMCGHSLEHAKQRGFHAMQFNFVVSTNARAINLWHRQGFAIIGRLPNAFNHPRLGFVDAVVMFRPL